MLLLSLLLFVDLVSCVELFCCHVSGVAVGVRKYVSS